MEPINAKCRGYAFQCPRLSLSPKARAFTLHHALDMQLLLRHDSSGDQATAALVART